MTQHTQGPWTVNHDNGEYIGILGNNGRNARGQKYVAAVQYSESAQKEYLPSIPSHIEAKANARLIAAAPDLLSALIDCLEALEGEQYKQAKAAITKAKGE